jgi:hypothetical protein
LLRFLADLALHQRGVCRRAAKEPTDMTKSPKANLWRTFALAGFMASASVIASAAFAGECPAGAMKPDAREPVTCDPIKQQRGNANENRCRSADYRRDRADAMFGADHDCFSSDDVRFAVDVHCVAQNPGDDAGWLVVARSKSLAERL